MRLTTVVLVVGVLVCVMGTSVMGQCSNTGSNVCSCVQQTGCGICIGSSGGLIGSCTAGTAAGPNNGTTCSGQWRFGSAVQSDCSTAASCSGNPAQSCACAAAAGCGFCAVNGGTGAVCQGGSATGPYASAELCSGGRWINSEPSECKVAKAKAIGGIIAAICVPIFFMILLLIWWCCRGRYWWRSTNHKRCLCDEDACCNGFLCCHPYDAQPPPHTKSGESVKGRAVRVAPCFPHNPVAACSNIDAKLTPEEVEAYNELHPCGCGLGCRCYWVPGLCCWSWPGKCLQCCEDQLEGPPGGGKPSKADKKAAKKDKKKGGLFGKKKNKNQGDSAV